MVRSSSRSVLSALSPAAHGSAYLLTHRSWTSRMGTGFRKWSFSRPRRRVTTSPASSSCLRCFITPKRVIEKRSSSWWRVWPSSRKSSSSRLRRVGSASALNTGSTEPVYVTDQSHVNGWLRRCPRLREDLDPADPAVVGELEGEALRGAQRRAVDLDRLRQLGERDTVGVRHPRHRHLVAVESGHE